MLRAKFTINSIYCTLQFQYWCFVYAVRFGPLTFYPSSRSKWIFYFAEKSQSISEWHHSSHVTIGRTWYIELRYFSTVGLDIMFLVLYGSLPDPVWGVRPEGKQPNPICSKDNFFGPFCDLMTLNKDRLEYIPRSTVSLSSHYLQENETCRVHSLALSPKSIS